ncbi:MAG: hypothetical protein ACP5VP_07515 [Candidatus Limnocylindrales bacterium]
MSAPTHVMRRLERTRAGSELSANPKAAGKAAGPGRARRNLARLGQGLPRLSLLLLVTAQLADLATFGLAVRTLGIGGEIGPLRIVYRMAGFGGVAVAKLVAVLVMIVILELYSRRTGGGRWLAVVVAAMGILGALTNVLSLL